MLQDLAILLMLSLQAQGLRRWFAAIAARVQIYRLAWGIVSVSIKIHMQTSCVSHMLASNVPIAVCFAATFGNLQMQIANIGSAKLNHYLASLLMAASRALGLRRKLAALAVWVMVMLSHVLYRHLASTLAYLLMLPSWAYRLRRWLAVSVVWVGSMFRLIVYVGIYITFSLVTVLCVAAKVLNPLVLA